LGKRGGRVIDFGCGNGLWLAALGHGWEKHGVELSETAAQRAREFAGAVVHCGVLESFTAAPGTFDVALGFAVIEHLSDPEILVRRAWELLAPGGLMVLMTGDRESQTAVRMGDAWPLYQPEEHVSFFSARSLGRLAEHVGFEILRREWRYMYPPAGHDSTVRRWIHKAREALGWNGSNIHDHLFLYARKPLETSRGTTGLPPPDSVGTAGNLVKGSRA
jgi:SAM-dependent methyltransferase